jgi:FkbM family methyltransferase
LLWRGSRTRRPVEVSMTSGERLTLRPPPAEDLSVAVEIFIAGAYDPPVGFPKLEPRLVVDVGSNVGFSVLLFSRRYPAAKILAVEPHPEHLAPLYRHILSNRLTERVEVVGAAVSNANGRAHLDTAEAESRLTGVASNRTVPVRVRDFFEEVADLKIDFLKMDIEGGEFEIMSDPRFADLDITALVLEWHNTDRTPDGKSWSRARLAELGYHVLEGKLDYGRAGVLWAWKAAV